MAHFLPMLDAYSSTRSGRRRPVRVVVVSPAVAAAAFVVVLGFVGAAMAAASGFPMLPARAGTPRPSWCCGPYRRALLDEEPPNKPSSGRLTTVEVADPPELAQAGPVQED